MSSIFPDEPVPDVDPDDEVQAEVAAQGDVPDAPLVGVDEEEPSSQEVARAPSAAELAASLAQGAAVTAPTGDEPTGDAIPAVPAAAPQVPENPGPRYTAAPGSAASAADRSAFSLPRLREKPKSQIKLAPLPCGIVLFDHPDEMASGTAYLPETPAQRIRSPNDLRNDVLWVSNLSAFEDRIRQHPNLRSAYYLRIALTEIAHDLGVQCTREGQMAPDDAQRLSILMTRTMTIAARAYGWDVAELGPLMVQESFLMKDIMQRLPAAPAPDARFRDQFTRALTQAYQDASEPDWTTPTFEPDSVYVTLRYNRLNYVQQILDFPLPTGNKWAYMDGIAAQDNLLQFCLERPTLVKATIEWDNASSDMAALAAYGKAGRKRAPMRQWMAQPELQWLSQYARVTITAAWVDQSGYTRLPLGARLPAIFTAHPESALSYSAGLVAYNHWLAVASCTWNRRDRKEESNLWATWLRSLDRAMMFSMALKAYEAGFHVDRYGAGSLRLRVPRERLVELAQFKEAHGFMYPDLRSLLQRSELG